MASGEWDDGLREEDDDMDGCVLGEACLCPHYDHDSSECFTAEMAEEWARENSVTGATVSARKKAVTVTAAILLAVPWLLGVPVLTEDWFTGHGPAWWHWLRGERPRS